jgi:glycosyltransferase involved in cell wall biosynthesis
MTGSKVRVLQATVGLGLGGAEKVMALLAGGLDRNRYEVEALALKGWGPAGDRLKGAGVPVTALGGRGLWDPSVLGRARRFLKERAFDVIHAHVLWAGAAAALLKGPAKLVWHEHDTDDWMGPAARGVQSWAVRRADAVLTVSGAVARGLSARFPFLKPVVVLNTLPAAAGGPLSAERKAAARASLAPAEPDGPWVGWVGRMEEPKKGLSTLLRAVPALAARHPAARLVLVGDGPARAGLEVLARELGVAGRVRFVGARQDAAALCGAFDVFALPSLWEGFGMVLLEAMAAGVPAVASRVGGVPEVMGETGVLVPPGDPAALAAALAGLLDRPAEVARLGEAAFRRARTFRLEDSVARVQEIYEECLGGRP